MKISVIVSPAVVEELYFTGKNTVVIDVLRATSSMVYALMNGAREIVPVGSFEYAMKASSTIFGGQTLLAGERNTKKIDGFNLGNSPLEYGQKVVSGKGIVMFTTNGTKAIVKAKYSSNIFIASFLNLNAVAAHLLSLNDGVDILCSGRNGRLSLEDTVCAGKLIQLITASGVEAELDDSALTAVALAKSQGKNLKKMMLSSDHGKILIENGFADDITFCAKTNITDIIPVFTNGAIKPLQKETAAAETEANENVEQV